MPQTSGRFMKKVFCPIDGKRMTYKQTRGPYYEWYDTKLKRKVTAKEVGSPIVREFFICPKCFTIRFFDVRIDDKVELVLVISQAQDRSITVIHPQSLLFGPQYEIISDDEESRLGKVWGLLAGGAASRIQGLQMALEFWRVAATYANRPHYALMFTVMALEALCAKDAGDPRYRSEIRYRFTQRLGAFLGIDGADKKRIMKEMGQCYDLRSSLAHGAQANETEAKTLLPVADRTLRDTVNRFLESGKPRDWNDVIFGVPTVS
jgi:hypothetical protein